MTFPSNAPTHMASTISWSKTTGYVKRSQMDTKADPMTGRISYREPYILGPTGKLEFRLTSDESGETLLFVEDARGIQSSGESFVKFKSSTGKKELIVFVIDGEPAMAPAIAANAFQSEYVVFTGTLESMTREEAARHVTKLGGVHQGSITNSTTLLVSGEKTGSKMAKAKARGIKIIDEDEFLKRIGKK
jgi:NAD-dependent DNA ligase